MKAEEERMDLLILKLGAINRAVKDDMKDLQDNTSKILFHLLDSSKEVRFEAQVCYKLATSTHLFLSALSNLHWYFWRQWRVKDWFKTLIIKRVPLSISYKICSRELISSSSWFGKPLCSVKFHECIACLACKVGSSDGALLAMSWLCWHIRYAKFFDSLLLTFYEDNGWVHDTSGMAVHLRKVLCLIALTFLITNWSCPSNWGNLQTSVMCRTMHSEMRSHMRAPLVSWIYETTDFPSIHYNRLTCRIYRSTVLETPMSWCIDKCIYISISKW